MRNIFLTLTLALAAGCTSAAAPVFDEARDVPVVRASMGKVINGEPDSIRPSAVPGLYEVVYGQQFFYVSADGRYAVGGDLVDVEGRVNLSEERRTEMRAEKVKQYKGAIDKLTKDAIVYAPAGQRKHVITVFTDVDCGYCRKLHSGMKEMNDLGIEVRYLAYPRAGVGSPTYKKMVSVWCAKDQKKAMDQVKGGGEPKETKCENTIAQQYALGQSLGVSGTPTILLEDGRMVPGYLPPAQLAQMLDGKP
jgi:thiol:disulfide interchange protein DsbC